MRLFFCKISISARGLSYIADCPQKGLILVSNDAYHSYNYNYSTYQLIILFAPMYFTVHVSSAFRTIVKAFAMTFFMKEHQLPNWVVPKQGTSLDTPFLLLEALWQNLELFEARRMTKIKIQQLAIERQLIVLNDDMKDQQVCDWILSSFAVWTPISLCS